MIYPIGKQNFENLRSEGFVYVDKTALIYKLVKEGCAYFLLPFYTRIKERQSPVQRVLSFCRQPETLRHI